MRKNRGIRNFIVQPLAALILFFSTAFTSLSESGPGIPRPSKFVQIDYSTIDNFARNTPESATRNLSTLGTYLTSPARTDLAKARSVYTWITSHIQYDESAFSGQRYSSEIDYANKVLRNRKAVCTGFALLFKHLLAQAGIPVVNIKGYSRTNDSEAGQAIQRIDHEWNAVQLDGDWYLLDIAWAQTTAKPDADGKLQPNDFFFLTEPAAFAANHFPVDPRWQLLNPVLSKTQFDRFPKVCDAYFRLGFNADFPKNGQLPASNELSISLQNDSDVEFMCSLGQQGSSTARDIPMSIQRTDGNYLLTVSIPQQGASTLYVFAKPKGPRNERVKSYEQILSYTVAKR